MNTSEELQRDGVEADGWAPPPDLRLVVGPGLDVDRRRFGELLERLRRHANLSRADAAAKLGFSAEYLRLIEVGKRSPALGQMQRFLDAYAADGAVEEVLPGGDRPDLIVLDPLNGDPVIVQFKSRIREAGRSAVGAGRADEDGSRGANRDSRGNSQPSVGRAAELGLVVTLLTQADDSTLSRIRELLEDDLDQDMRIDR